MKGIQTQAGTAPFEVDDCDELPTFYTSNPQTHRRNADVEAAMQYLTWALEHIEKAGSQAAVRHTQAAMAALRRRVTQIADKD